MSIACYVFAVLAPVFVLLNGFSLHEAIKHPTFGVYSATTPLLLSAALFATLPELTRSARPTSAPVSSILLPLCYLGLALNLAATLTWTYRHYQLRQIIVRNHYDAHYDKVIERCGKSAGQVAFVHSCEDGIAKIRSPRLSVLGWPHVTLVGYLVLAVFFLCPSHITKSSTTGLE
ncbi:hypothetical protein B0I72DRAFT_162399 [Yarrowia lipolytica]|jgi:hypothetical protein|uniref:YALI0B07051p n=2 Tax=Yarrowia lipolytica TaxID=4952 RepID=Q6CFG9_YARLI|nr:YALI0B07051p [Yarrowia lipolytica CLIB122]AOW01337.1 hypothetical protein YALI1_B09132g [Yarrowia lipolytica]KAB8281835.1 hypothetical protein BKA91DRAFT_163092 [Yarrowia lipolytica]KAE8171606.1 hypothetical protein BKA90DRAFT_157797 [Yarrowia lipolytica]KAJ8052194.1 hypothetical protein LXG23DRAFT_51686 [Yarrowia lipolytica]QNP96604.1 Hypothetical protein YALI2_C00257g [Yarrowia lipolytica]|eukprot:XP_500593.1 YALI0B07051p [Yarrowia lipolytica CLIB122]